MIKRAVRPIEPVPISVARSRLFELVEDVLDGRADRIALSHKGHAERVILMRADALAKLEADLAALRARIGPDPRPLRGLATVHVPAEDVLRDVRAQQAHLAAAKQDTIFGALEGTSAVGGASGA